MASTSDHQVKEAPDERPTPPAVERELDDHLRRALADLDNLRKRYSRELARESAQERASVVSEWLAVVDNLERALEHSGEGDDAVVEGLRAVHEQAVALLDRLGFPRFDDVGEPFDASRHEAISVVEADAPAGTVITAVRPGYGRPDAVLRPAAVVVSKGRS